MIYSCFKPTRAPEVCHQFIDSKIQLSSGGAPSTLDIRLSGFKAYYEMQEGRELCDLLLPYVCPES